jgi:hypothetical protein
MASGENRKELDEGPWTKKRPGDFEIEKRESAKLLRTNKRRRRGKRTNGPGKARPGGSGQRSPRRAADPRW